MDFTPNPIQDFDVKTGQDVLDEIGKIQYHRHTEVDGTPKISYNDLTDLPESVSAAGNDTELQYNDNGSFAGIPTVTYDKTTTELNLNSGTGANDTGGDISITAGDGSNTSNGGSIMIQSGYAGGSTGSGGDVDIVASDSADSAHNGGEVYIQSGFSVDGGNGRPGNLVLAAGESSSSAATSANRGAVVMGGVNNSSVYHYYVNKTYSSGTSGTLFSFALPPSSQNNHLNPHQFIARVVGTSNNGDAVSYVVTATYARNNAAAPALIGSIQTTYTAENNAAWNATFNISSNNINLDVSFDSSPASWRAEISIISI